MPPTKQFTRSEEMEPLKGGSAKSNGANGRSNDDGRSKSTGKGLTKANGKGKGKAKSRDRPNVKDASGRTSSTVPRTKEPVSLRELKWRGVTLPEMSLASERGAGGSGSRGGSSENVGDDIADEEMQDADDEEGGDAWDPFAGLDEGAEDYMGLQELSGVGVKYQGTSGGGKQVGFYKLGDNLAKPPGAKQGRDGMEEPIASKASNDRESKKQTQSIEKKKKKDQKKGPQDAEHKNTKEKDPDKVVSQIEKDADASRKDKPKKAVTIEEGHKAILPSAQQHDTSEEEEEAIPDGIFSSFAANLEGREEDYEVDQLADTTFTGKPRQRVCLRKPCSRSSLPDLPPLPQCAPTSTDSKLPLWPTKVLSRLHPLLKTALRQMGFDQPTPVQMAALPKVLPVPSGEAASSTQGEQDLVGIAHTGSGKTLAYALPILQRILAARQSIYDEGDASSPPPLGALIVLPTRELAMQVYEVFQKIIKASTSANGEASTSGSQWVRIAPVMGGMSEERQWRLLRGRKHDQEGKDGQGKDAEIIIATVGRLWELCKSDDYLPSRLRSTRNLVLDEADRLLEMGKFKELSSILDLLQADSRQTMMFSATLDPSLQVNLSKSRDKVSKAMKRSKGEDRMTMLVDKVGFRSQHGVAVVDLTKDDKVAQGLLEGKVECVDKEKVSAAAWSH